MTGGRKRLGDLVVGWRAAGRVLLSHGFPHKQAKAYQDGLADWEKAGLPVDR